MKSLLAPKLSKCWLPAYYNLSRTEDGLAPPWNKIHRWVLKQKWCVLVLFVRLPCLHLSWQQDLATQRINPGSSSWVLLMSYHGHWDLPESTYCHVCTAVTEALSSLLLYPSSWGSQTDQPFEDPSQSGKDFSRKHTLSLFRKHQWVLQRATPPSPFFQTTPSLHLIHQLSWDTAKTVSYTVRSTLAFGRKRSALEDSHCATVSELYQQHRTPHIHRIMTPANTSWG